MLPTLTLQLRAIEQPPSVTHNPLTMTNCPLPLGVSAPFPADLFQNVSCSPRLLLVLQIPLTLLREVKVTCNGGKSYKPMNFSYLSCFCPFFLHIILILSTYIILLSSALSVLFLFGDVFLLLIYKSNATPRV